MKALPFVLALPLLLAGCSKVDLDVVGQWRGGFVPETSAPEGEFKGFVQLYARGNYKLEMSTDNQRLVINGRWSQEKLRLTLTSESVKVENPSEEDVRVLKLKILEADNLRTVFGKPLILDLSADKKTLTGLDQRAGTVAGKLLFRKPER